VGERNTGMHGFWKYHKQAEISQKQIINFSQIYQFLKIKKIYKYW
jgi:hypothetical protein